MTTNNTTLPIKKILLSLIGFAIIPSIAVFVSNIIHNTVVSYTLAFHLSSLFLFGLNWDIISVHYHRFIEDLKESFFFIFIGTIILLFVFYINYHFFQAYILILNPQEIKNISFFLPLTLFAYSYLFSSVYLIAFKNLSDRLVIKKAEITVIFFSSFLFALFFVVAFIPFSVIEWLKGYIFYFFITMILSYLYNQTKSLFTSLITFSLVLFIINCLALL